MYELGDRKMPIAIIGAMDEEIDVFRSMLTNEKEVTMAHVLCIEGEINGIEVVVLKSGIGKVNAAIATTLVIERYHPRVIINTGSAGGFVQDLLVGDVVISKSLVQHDVDVTAFNYEHGQVPGLPATIPASEMLITIAEEAMKKIDLSYQIGLIGSGDVFMENKERVAGARKLFPTMLAAEMEGAALAQVCYQYDVPFVVIRSLSDIAGKESSVSFEEYLQIAAQNAGKCIEYMIEHIEYM